MSLLVELLSKLKRHKKGKSVSPLLEHIHKKQSKRSRIAFPLIVVFLASFSMVAGFLAVSFLSKSDKKSIEVAIEKKQGGSAKDVANAKSAGVLKNKEIQRQKPEEIIKEKTEEELIVKKTKENQNATRRKRASVANRAGQNEKEHKEETDLIVKDKRREERESKDYYIYYAVKAEKRGRYYDAIRMYKKALAIDREDYRIMNKLSYIFLKTGQYHEAIRYSKAALEKRPDYVRAMINLSVALKNTGQINGAVEVLERALKKDPSNDMVLYNLAVLYEETGRYERAEKYFSVLSKKGRADAIIGLGRIRERRGDLKGAIFFYSTALSVQKLDNKMKEWLRKRISLLSQATK